MNHPGSDKDPVLSSASIGLSETCRPERVVPSLVVHGSIPRIASGQMGIPGQDTLMNLIMISLQQMEDNDVKLIFLTVLKKRALKSTHPIIAEAYHALVCRKKEKHSCWTGPFQVLKVEGKLITVED